METRKWMLEGVLVQIIQEALLEVIHYGFSMMKLHSVQANVNPGNTSAIELLVTSVFSREDYFNEEYFLMSNFSTQLFIRY